MGITILASLVLLLVAQSCNRHLLTSANPFLRYKVKAEEAKMPVSFGIARAVFIVVPSMLIAATPVGAIKRTVVCQNSLEHI